MLWMAAERGLQLAEATAFPAGETWAAERDALADDIVAQGYDEAVGGFVQAYGGQDLDASTAIVSWFLPPDDARVVGTLNAILKTPAAGGLTIGSSVYRYDVDRSPDGIEGGEGFFNFCTLWVVEALARAGRTDPDALMRAYVGGVACVFVVCLLCVCCVCVCSLGAQARVCVFMS